MPWRLLVERGHGSAKSVGPLHVGSAIHPRTPVPPLFPISRSRSVALRAFAVGALDRAILERLSDLLPR